MNSDLDANFIIGGDPEFFCKNIETGEYVSLIPYIRGTKKRPQKIEVKGCSQLRDNVLLELNLPPVPEFWMLHRIIDDCIKYSNTWLKEINPNFELDVISSAYFSDDELQHREAMEIGCEPAYSIYNWKRPVPRSSFDAIPGLRTASYHIHYGWENEASTDTLRYFILLNDIFLGFPALYLDSSDELRKNLYGQLGEHRIKKSGIPYEKIEKNNRIEYRSLGAGIHKFPGFIEKGIDMVRSNVSNIQYFVDEYYEDFKTLSSNLSNAELKENIKQKLIKNGHYNR
jgi:hypothetical protein